MNKLIRLATITLSSMLVWQSIVYFLKLPPYILPAPTQVLISFKENFFLLIQHCKPTLIATAGGFLLGILLGCSTALIIGFYRPIAIWLLPIILISQAVPTFAIAPLLVIWFGYGITTKIITAALMIFFPVTSSFYDGLRKNEREWLVLAKTMGATKWKTFYHIRIPAALPYLASGVRVAAVTAPLGAVVSEWVGSSQGLGYLMLNANARMQIDMMYAALLLIIIMTLWWYFCIDHLLRRIIWWHV